MSYMYPANIVADPTAVFQSDTAYGKRPYYQMHSSVEPEWSSSKRPRRVSTPNSAISIVTEEGQVTPNTPHSAIPHTIHSHLSADLHPHSPSPQSFQPHSPQSPCYTRSSLHSSPDYALRSDHDIVVDVDNSFATGQTGSVAWTNSMLVQVLANDIEDLCYTNEENGASGISDEYHNFFSQYKQPFELDFYIRRLVQYSNCSTAAFVTMLVYLDRVQERCKELLITEMNCHRIICTALVLAIKYLDDEVFSNGYYARVGGVTCEEMNDLELKMLKVLAWNLSVTPETYALYEDGLIQSARLLGAHHPPASPASGA